MAFEFNVCLPSKLLFFFFFHIILFDLYLFILQSATENKFKDSSEV